jgi:aspartate/tyrosine/aromatic aminotransferase
MSFFGDVALLTDDPILSLPIAFAADPRPFKVNLGIGAYQTAEGMPLLLNSVRKAEIQIFQKNLNKAYLPIEGDAEFLNYALQLLFGVDLNILNREAIFSAQTVGGSGALRIAAEFLAKNIGKTIFISQPSWSNHKLIFERAGLTVGSYPYFNTHTHRLDFAGMCEAINNMPPASIIVMHGCCHNPTGMDPNLDQWRELSLLIKKKRVIPLFDIAYQGFGKDLNSDAQSIRQFAKDGHEMLVCYSFSKNFGLYGERLGFLTILNSLPEATLNIGSQIKYLVRGSYSTPPLHGERIVKNILKSRELTMEWQVELNNMRDRIKEMRIALVAALLTKSSRIDFSYIKEQSGLFSFCGLNTEQVLRLREEKGIYMPTNGRVNIAGLNTQNLDYVAESILTVI